MKQRLQVQKVWRGKYRIVLDGVSVGSVAQDEQGTWSGTPLVSASPDAVLSSRARQTTRRDAIEALLDEQGLPASIAADLLQGEDLDDQQEEWVAPFLARFN